MLCKVPWAFNGHFHLIVGAILDFILSYQLHGLFFMSIPMIVATLDLNLGCLNLFLLTHRINPSFFFYVTSYTLICMYRAAPSPAWLQVFPRESTVLISGFLFDLLQLLSEVHDQTRITAIVHILEGLQKLRIRFCILEMLKIASLRDGGDWVMGGRLD